MFCDISGDMKGNIMIITIDGPTASGKTTVGKALAQKLGMFYLYSGSLFRVLAYLLQDQYGYTKETIANISKQEITDIVLSCSIEYIFKNGDYYLFVNGIDVTKKTTNDTIGLLASIVGANGHVREFIAHWQKRIAQHHENIIIDGRDAGTYVFPHADKKLFITASSEERSRRLQHKQEKMSEPINFDVAFARIQERDNRDTNREIAPLKIADDAVVIDTTGLDVQETIDRVFEIVKIAM